MFNVNLNSFASFRWCLLVVICAAVFEAMFPPPRYLIQLSLLINLANYLIPIVVINLLRARFFPPLPAEQES